MQTKHAKENGGVMGQHMIQLPLEQIVPNTMHCVMGITNKLFSLLSQEAMGDKTLTKKWVHSLETKCGVILPVEGEKPCTFFQR